MAKRGAPVSVAARMDFSARTALLGMALAWLLVTQLAALMVWLRVLVDRLIHLARLPRPA